MYNKRDRVPCSMCMHAATTPRVMCIWLYILCYMYRSSSSYMRCERAATASQPPRGVCALNVCLIYDLPVIFIRFCIYVYARSTINLNPPPPLTALLFARSCFWIASHDKCEVNLVFKHNLLLPVLLNLNWIFFFCFIVIQSD